MTNSATMYGNAHWESSDFFYQETFFKSNSLDLLMPGEHNNPNTTVMRKMLYNFIFQNANLRYVNPSGNLPPKILQN